MTHFIRKRDGQRYTCDLRPVTWPKHEMVGPCYILRPIWEGRAHYKSIKAFEHEYKRVED